MPIAAFLPAIIGAAGSIGGALLSKRGSGGSELLPAGLDVKALQDAIGSQKELGGFLTRQGQENLDDPLNFYQSIIGGDRTNMMQTLAPEISAINAQYQAPLTEAKLQGRESSLVPDIEAQRQGRISDLMFGLRPQAADKLSSIAMSLLNQGGNTMSDVSGKLVDYNVIMRGIQQQGQARSSSMWSSLGGSLGNILSGILTPGGGGGTAGSVPKAGNIGNIFGTMNPSTLPAPIKF